MLYRKQSNDIQAKMTAPSQKISKPNVPVKFQQWGVSIANSNAGSRIKLIRNGVDANILVSASEYFNMPRAQFVKFLGMSPATAERKIKSRSLLSLAESERLERLAVMENFAEEVFGAAELAKS